ncbi:hypothetical protein dsat_2176 [Alkalidesulfovibrio alkalitolerans DSM 16529]|uniref:Spore protein YkvP/CgeB glycosyl transferase-like domain-containing protein n=1 Tax=Alkalidesulfovibrio alkalitolerans DSM 16529 TaxID=1121439 RepID=S7TFU0_9BACT|nr:glycosyltransferase [Alkalidesulfovibrio alkalitolerans]EPR35475.1 hypothetical protein dsat_2176 [Alkalidesulfovibrio alkalitolerans DSM 16529]
MRICLVTCGWPVRPLRDMGHEVLHLDRPSDGSAVLDLPRALEAARFAPDFVVQEELLDRRILCAGLGDVTCPKIFLSRDTHLNAWWTAHYGRCFDGVATTQPDWVSRLKSMGLAQVGVVSWHGHDVPFTPHGERKTPVAFVGRLHPSRQARGWLVELLARRFGARVESTLPPGKVLPLYADTLLAPNECILGEINMRLFEAASAGACVLTPDLGEAQARFFEPGREILVYRDALELCALIERLRTRPAETERIGRAARERVRATHLPAHRAAELLDFARGLSPAALTGDAARGEWAMAARLLSLSQRLSVASEALEPELSRLALGGRQGRAGRADAAVLLLRVLWERGAKEEAASLLRTVLSSGLHGGNAAFAAAAYAAALRLGQPEMARLLAQRPFGKARLVPREPGEAFIFLAKELRARGALVNPGFPFDPARDLPATAVECLLCAQLVAPASLQSCKLLDLWLADQPGLEGLRLGWLSHLSLHEPREWRHALRLGATNLRCYRPDQGMEELRLGLSLAREQGREALFARALSAAHLSPLPASALGLST